MTRPIFIVGTMRSGSTLLRLILDSHDNIAIGEETGFAAGLSAARTIPGWRYGGEWSTRIGWDRAELDEQLRDMYTRMFERHATMQGKKRWGDKTPFHSWHMTDLAEVFPDAQFVAIVRHPAGVVASLVKKFHYTVPQAAAYWAATNVEVLRHGVELGDDRFVLVRYEDVVGDPEPVLRELTDWLGEAWTDDLLRHERVQVAKGAPRLVDGSTSTRAPIDAARADSWRHLLSPADLAVVRDATERIAALLGYHLDDGTDGSDSRPGSVVDVVDVVDVGSVAGDAAGPYRRVLTGTALAARHRSLPDPVDLSPPQHQGRGDTGMEMTPEEMARRVEKAEAALARIRARPVVRASEAVRRAQRRLSLPTVAELRTALRRRTGWLRRPPRA